jgi:RND family efflux transporter MFP subunit
VSGGYFEKGEPLLRIDPIDFEVALERARADLAQAESEDIRARKELARQLTLAEQNVASASRVDDAENAAKVSSAVLRHGKAVLRKASRDLARTEMQAPYRGRVRKEQVDLGQFVSRGSPIATIYAVDYVEVRLPIADDELAYLDLGLRPGEVNGEGPAVTLRARFAGRDRSWRGRVVRTEGEIDPQSRMVRVVAQIEDPLGEAHEGRAPLEVGLFVDAEIQGLTFEDAVVLPREALRDGNQVFVVDADNRLRFRDVDVARVERDQVVVRGGLATDEQVCISPLATAVDGMIVRIAPTARQEPGS